MEEMDARPEDDVLDLLDGLVRERRGELLGLARREGLSPVDAVDCVHDALCTFLELELRGRLPEGEAAQAAFLSGVVVNTARNLRRRHPLARPHLELAVEPVAEPSASSEALLSHAEDCIRLRGCVDRLCDNQRTVVMMRLLEERQGEDVAAQLGLTRGHVDVLLHRAKHSLAACMAEGER